MIPKRSPNFVKCSLIVLLRTWVRIVVKVVVYPLLHEIGYFFSRDEFLGVERKVSTCVYLITCYIGDASLKREIHYIPGAFSGYNIGYCI